MAIALIGLGSNVGDRQQILDRALEFLGRHSAVRIVARSRWRETAPVGGPPGQGTFLNGAALLETSLEPFPLASLLFDTEAQLGRQRRVRWDPRTLDLDLLLFGDRIIETPHLVVPHARMAWRRFVLEPAAEIAPSMVHPVIGWTVARLLDHIYTALPYVAIAGPPGVGKGALARRLVDRMNQRRPGSARLIADPIHSLAGGRRRPDWPSDAFQRELQFLMERARLLKADLPDWSVARMWAISDFWLDQSLAHAEASLGAEGRAALRRAPQDLDLSVVPAKLLVLWSPNSDPLAQAIAGLARGCGPILALSGPGLDPAVEEVLAAIDAME
jgi:2-amino-4-hydroxy-6-hydroxymethyldihydropteridine diphosphokinase